MNCLSHARSYVSWGLLKRSSYFSSHIPWDQCFFLPPKPASLNAFGLSTVHCFASKSKASKTKTKSTVPVAVVDKEKEAFFVVRKGDIIGVYKDFSDCQAQVGSSVFDPPVSIYKGYSLPKDVEDYLSSVGLKKPLYTFRASDLKENMFGSLTSCLFQKPTSGEDKVSTEEDTTEMKSKDITKDKQDQRPSPSMSVDPLEELPKPKPSVETLYETCVIEFDGASKGNPGLAGAGVVLKNVDGSLICRVRQGLGIATNNAAEYRALILGLKHAIEKGYKRIKMKGDSKLVCMQLKGLWKVHHEGLAKLHMEAKQLTAKCSYFEISHVLRELNSDADEQANLASRLSEGEVEVA